jgi:hypothetical protein
MLTTLGGDARCFEPEVSQGLGEGVQHIGTGADVDHGVGVVRRPHLGLAALAQCKWTS